jgi:hypothetical protein
MSLIGKYLVQSLLRSITGKAFEKAPPGTPLNIMGNQMQKYNPINMMYETAKQIPMLGEGIASLKNTLMPEAYGTSQKEFQNYQKSYDDDLGFGKGSFQNMIDNIYGQGGIMQGYNPVSAFGSGPIGAIENRISSIMNRTAPMTDFARNQIWNLYDARDQLVGGQGINAVTRAGTYGYDDATIGGGGDGGSSSSSDSFSSQGFGSEGNTSVSTDFGSFDFSRD